MTPDQYPFPFKPGQVDVPRRWGVRDVAALVALDVSLDHPQFIEIVAVCFAESNGDPIVKGRTVWAPGKATHLTYAIGLFQLLKAFHVDARAFPDLAPMTLEEAFDPFANWRRAFAVMQRKRPTPETFNLTWWTAYNSRTYLAQMNRASTGVRDYRAWLASGA